MHSGALLKKFLKDHRPVFFDKVSLSPYKKIAGEYLKTEHTHLFPYPLQSTGS
jgi:hypothetical protein